MDRNTVIGFILIGVLLVVMLVVNSKSNLAYQAEQQKRLDSIATVKRIKDSIAAKNDTTKSLSIQSGNDSLQPGKKINSGFQSNIPAEQMIVVENEVLKITFSNKGAQPRTVELKKFKKPDGKPLIIQQGNFNRLAYNVNTSSNHTDSSDKLIFTPSAVIENSDKTKSIDFTLSDSSGRKITHQYVIRPDDYLIDLNVSIVGANNLFSQNAINFSWQSQAEQLEKDHAYESSQTHICYLTDNDYDFEYIGSGDSKEFNKSVDWISVKQQFFITALGAKDKFVSANASWKVPADTNSKYLTQVSTTARHNLSANNVTVPLQLYYGPSDYNILKKYGNKMENIVPYGSGIFAFVKYINRYFLLPVFDFIKNNIASMGIVILLLTLLIRVITSPILYKSYLSGAKMKALKPEVDALRAKYKDDQQAFGMEQMKLWRSAGVSPLGGCLPALLQIPIFMSLYYFFQSNIDLRGKNFLWAEDLASYDSIAKLPFDIPFYGDHVSLFTLTAVVTSLLISIYSMSNMQDNSNPLMKYMPYIFPVLLLGVFNKLPAALTWYYTVSNTITLILQIVIQKYIINHEKILAQIGENRKKPVKKSKMAERIEAMQESQRKLQEMKKKANRN